MTGVRARNRRGEGGRLRGDILAAASAILDETGDEQAISLRAVARRAGISAPSIYPHFRDRDAILLALTRDAFAALTEHLRTASTVAGDATGRLFSVCAAYLAFATDRPEHYRLMFGGVWNATKAVQTESITAEDAASLGQDALRVIIDALEACVEAGKAASRDTFADAVALWLGLHGLAHQRTLSASFPWPADITERLIRSLARLP